MRGNCERIGGKRVLGRGSNGVSGTQLVMNYVKVFILRAVGGNGNISSRVMTCFTLCFRKIAAVDEKELEQRRV